MTQEFKQCSQGDKCIHPNGPLLPRTAEYFYMSNGHATARCRLCMREYRKKRYRDSPDHEAEINRQYREKNKGKWANYRDKYHARKRANGGSYTHDELDTLYKSQKGLCWWCGEFVGLTFDIDHRIPVSKGGTTDISNIVISCRKCNRSKNDKLPHEWNGRLL